MTIDWETLQRDHRAGRFESRGSLTKEHFVFEDGTLWFTNAYEHRQGAALLVPVLAVPFVGACFAVVVAVHDGAWWWTIASAIAAALLLSLAAALRSSSRAEKALRDRLGIGLFLGSDRLVARDGSGYERQVARDAVQGLVMRHEQGGGSTRTPIWHLEVRGEEEVSTRIRATNETERVLRAWLGADGESG